MVVAQYGNVIQVTDLHESIMINGCLFAGSVTMSYAWCSVRFASGLDVVSCKTNSGYHCLVSCVTGRLSL
jgi:hypothetical protein